MNRITIRPAVERDVPLILQLIQELAEYERSPHLATATVEQIRYALFGDAQRGGAAGGPASKIARCLVGEVDGVAQGIAFYFHNYSTWTGRAGVYLEDLFVRPSARGAGLGTALLARLAAITQEEGCPRLEWQVLDWNAPAISFYKNLGAEAMDQWTVFRLSGEALAKLAARGRP